MRQSNLYIVSFAAILTIVCGGLLALANQGLKPYQDELKRLDTRKQILSAVMSVEDGVDVNQIYESRINSYFVGANGEKLENYDANKYDPKKVYKEPDVAKKAFPVYEFKNESGSEVEAYIIPVYGKGLWDDVWGYVAFNSDLNTIKGISFGHKAETPGLGARITDLEVQDRFKNKKILNENGELVSVEFIKGEKAQTTFTDYQVDGLSGATMTSKGVNNMLKAYFGYYDNYFKTLRK